MPVLPFGEGGEAVKLLTTNRIEHKLLTTNLIMILNRRHVGMLDSDWHGFSTGGSEIRTINQLFLLDDTDWGINENEKNA